MLITTGIFYDPWYALIHIFTVIQTLYSHLYQQRWLFLSFSDESGCLVTKTSELL